MPVDLVSWLVLAGLAALVVAGVAARGRFERFFFELEDPRPIAAFRIVFAVLVVLHVHGLAPWWELLFEPTGMFTPAEARQQFAGGDAFVRPFSLLYFEVPFAWLVVAFDVCAAALAVGLGSRVSAVATLALFDTFFSRNPVYWEGTDVVLRVWLVYLACARCGHAWSIDAWLHRRRGGAAVREIPAWPRRLMVVQLGLLMASTGLVKHGGAWLDGDAAYLAVTSEFYARFDIADELAALGDGFITALSWTARTIEVGFPLVLVGIVGGWSAARPASPRPRARLVLRAALAFAFACSVAVVAWTGAPRLVPVASTPVAVVLWISAFALVAWAWPGRRGQATPPWWCGRPLWVGAAAALMLGMWSTMNIGLFHPAMLATLIPLLAPRRDEAADLAYTPRVRAVGSALLGWHLVALLGAALPDAPDTREARRVLGTVTGPWLALTRTTQSWGMWADPPRSTVFLRVVIVDDAGQSHTLRDDLTSAERIERSAWWYDRWWKIAGRIARAGPRSPYPAAYARWVCRRHPHARAVELWTTSVPIPTPAQRRAGAQLPAEPAKLHASLACGG